MKKNIKAFTLTELLVVVAITTIFALIICSVFASARETTRQASCLSHEKQLALAMLQYVQDYDRTFPVGDVVPGASWWGRGWASRLYPYVQSTAVYKCPDDPTEKTTGLNGMPETVNSVISYGFNCNLAPSNRVPTNLYSNKYLAGLNAPAKTVLFFEVQNAHEWLDPRNISSANHYITSPSGNSSDGAPGNIDTVEQPDHITRYATGALGNPPNFHPDYVVNPKRGRHSEGSNFALADGHVKFLDRQKVSSGYPNDNPACAQNYGGPECETRWGNAAGTGIPLFEATFSAK